MTTRSLKLISSMAPREVLIDLVAQYHRATGVAVECEAGGGVDVAKRVQAGEAFDVVVLAANAIDKLIAEGRLLAGSRVDLVKSMIVVAVAAGAPGPGIGSEQAVKAAVLAAKTLSYSTGPSGVHLERMFERWGILDAIRERVVVPSPGTSVGSLIADGRAEIGFQQFSEMMHVPGVKVLGALPPEIQSITTFSGGMTCDSGVSEAARQLLSFLAAPAADETKIRHGMERA